MHTEDQSFRMIKGRVAEAIIKQLFLECGFKVFENGIERNRPEILEHIGGNQTKVGKEIRFSPDFVVIKPSGEMFYLEVKYRANGYFSLNGDLESYPYKNAHFIIVSKTDIQWITYGKLLETGCLKGSENFKIENSDLFDLDPIKVSRYRKYVQDFFANIE